MNVTFKNKLLDKLRNKEFRGAYVSAHVRAGVAHQIRALRNERNWSQEELGKRSGKPQSVISRLEDPDYGKLSVQTLLDLASAFDVALMVGFVAFSEMLEKIQDVSPERLAVPNFSSDMRAHTRTKFRDVVAFGGTGVFLTEPYFLTGPYALEDPLTHPSTGSFVADCLERDQRTQASAAAQFTTVVSIQTARRFGDQPFHQKS